jgi:hypothetical protein
MAKVYLRSYGGREIVDLPPVCMACGAPATVRKSKQFSWQPQWVPILILAGLLPYLIVSIVLTKRQRVETPFCDKHASYWWLFPTLLTLSFFAILGVGFAGFVVLNALNAAAQNGPRGSDLSGFACLATVVGFLVWLIVAVVLQNMRIRPSEITDRHIELTKVSREFADAVDEEAERERREFDEPRRYRDEPRRPRSRGDDDRYREGDDERRYQR